MTHGPQPKKGRVCFVSPTAQRAVGRYFRPRTWRRLAGTPCRCAKPPPTLKCIPHPRRSAEAKAYSGDSALRCPVVSSKSRSVCMHFRTLFEWRPPRCRKPESQPFRGSAKSLSCGLFAQLHTSQSDARVHLLAPMLVFRVLDVSIGFCGKMVRCGSLHGRVSAVTRTDPSWYSSFKLLKICLACQVVASS
jgi:hypothetical protein